MANFWRKRVYQDEATQAGDLSKRGYVYQGGRFGALGGNATASIGFKTSSLTTIVYLRELTTVTTPVLTNVFEGVTFATTTGSATGTNLLRTEPNSSASLFASVTCSGGALIAQDLAGGGGKAGGIATCTKVRTLKKNENYLITLQNLTNQSTDTLVTLVWSEGEPEQYNVITEPNTTDTGIT
jgi:hypothetical protein